MHILRTAAVVDLALQLAVATAAVDPFANCGAASHLRLADTAINLTRQRPRVTCLKTAKFLL